MMLLIVNRMYIDQMKTPGDSRFDGRIEFIDTYLEYI